MCWLCRPGSLPAAEHAALAFDEPALAKHFLATYVRSEALGSEMHRLLVAAPRLARPASALATRPNAMLRGSLQPQRVHSLRLLSTESGDAAKADAEAKAAKARAGAGSCTGSWIMT